MKKLTKSEFYNLLFQAGQKCGESSSWRKGQSLYNTLYKINPELAKSICGNKSCDPYYLDERIEAFYKKIYK